MQLVATPTVRVALGIALRAAITRGGNLFEHLSQRLLALAFDRGGLRGWTHFAAPRAASLACRRRRFRHARLGRALFLRQ